MVELADHPPAATPPTETADARRRSARSCSYLGARDELDTAVVEFSRSYADRTELDFALPRGAVADGRIAARAGV